MTIEQERLTPTQEDREAAADAYASLCWAGDDVDDFEHAIRCGKEDDAPFVQAFARHRPALKSPPIGGEGDRTPAQFFFEVGFGACWAEAFVKNAGTPPFPLTDAAVERAWSIAGEAHDDPAEFDRYLALASSTEGERTEALCDAYNAGACDAAPGYAEMAEPTTSGDVGKLCEELQGVWEFIDHLPMDATQHHLNTIDQAATRIAALEAENAAAGRNIYRLQKVSTDLAEALRQCGDQFAFYAREHTAAGKLEKAATNQRFADLASSTLLAEAGS